VEPAKLDALYRDIETHVASDVMTSPAITISPEEEVGTAATLMFRNKISRLPVMRDGELVGIVARSDVIRLMADS
jgi:CBS domain-containing protein